MPRHCSCPSHSRGSSDFPRLSRREWMKLLGAGVVSYSMSGWVDALAADAAGHPGRKRACILLWMSGGPSQMDTFDLKPGHANGGPFKEISTAVPGVRISEHLPKVAKHMDRMAVVRSMSTKEGDHGRATYLLRTGYLPAGTIQYPMIGSLLARELGDKETALPNCVSIAPQRGVSAAAWGSGFLGPQYAPLIVGDGAASPPAGDGDNANANLAGIDAALKVQDLVPPKGVDPRHTDARVDLLKEMDESFVAQHPGAAPLSHQAAYQRAVKLVKTQASKAFNLEEEKPELRDAYGRNLFGQGCLLARRLVERGVPFVEVSLSNAGNNASWDSHAQNFDMVKALSEVLDPAWSTLMTDLKDRGMLDSTLIVWMGEFGRTPKINPNNGRDHFPDAWSTVLAGGGIKGGQAIGKTSGDGMKVEDRPVTVPDFLATVCSALGVDPTKSNDSNAGRPIRIVDIAAKPITEVLA
jgi:hypothetical protein